MDLELCEILSASFEQIHVSKQVRMYEGSMVLAQL